MPNCIDVSRWTGTTRSNTTFFTLEPVPLKFSSHNKIDSWCRWFKFGYETHSRKWQLSHCFKYTPQRQKLVVLVCAHSWWLSGPSERHRNFPTSSLVSPMLPISFLTSCTGKKIWRLLCRTLYKELFVVISWRLIF